MIDESLGMTHLKYSVLHDICIDMGNLPPGNSEVQEPPLGRNYRQTHEKMRWALGIGDREKKICLHILNASDYDLGSPQTYFCGGIHRDNPSDVTGC